MVSTQASPLPGWSGTLDDVKIATAWGVDAVVSADVHETPVADEFRSSRRRVPAVSRSVSRRKRPVIAARLAVRLGARPPAPTP
jgi:hypothetical protein